MQSSREKVSLEDGEKQPDFVSSFPLIKERAEFSSSLGDSVKGQDGDREVDDRSNLAVENHSNQL